MTPYVAGAAVLGLLTGIGVGWTLRDWMLRHGHTLRMPETLRRHSSLRTVLIALVLIALVSNALLGFLLIDQRAKSAASDARFRELVSCLAEYNADLGSALTDRDASIRSGTQSEIDLWGTYQELYDLAKRDPSKIPVAQRRLNRAIAAYREDLIETRSTRNANPYPPPALCGRAPERPSP